MSRYIPLAIAALSAATMIVSFLDKDYSETLIALTSVIGWVTVWEYRKTFG